VYVTTFFGALRPRAPHCGPDSL